MVEYQFATDEQRELAEGARTILEKELKPRIEELEHADDGRGKYPLDVQKTLVDAGYYAMSIPEKWGGLGMSRKTLAIIYEEMAKVEAGFTFSFMSAGGFFDDICLTHLSEKEKQVWAERLIAGDAMGCFTLTESMAGSDAGAMRTTAVKKGHEWVLNGTKCFCTNGSFANFFLIPAYTDKAAGPRNGVTCFLVEKERGVQVGKKENKLGMKLSETAEIVLDNVSVPEDHVIGEVGKGFSESLGHLTRWAKVNNIAVCVGIAQAALDYAIAYAKERRQFGKRIIDHQGIGFMIADMKARTEATRALLHYTVDALDNYLPAAEQLGCALKIIGADSTMQTTLDAVQVYGGYGYMKEYPVEKLMRDAKIFQIFGGSGQMQRKNMVKMIAGRDPQKAK